ncbi:hypothetical protein QUB68_29520 [Microcoleus sp. A006_D1]|uniref:hypothetical protein n=1 Tax=Microcoleus sp. A006_D1 TaxID=3055267 RepID=UPI002FD496C3
MAGDREIGKILEFGGVEALICRRCGGRAIGFPIGRAIDLEEPDINQRCYMAIVSLRELRSLDRDRLSICLFCINHLN